MVKLVIHLWNGRWGTLAKGDIRAYAEGGHVLVERAERNEVVERVRCTDAATAIAVMRAMVEADGGQRWRDITAASRPTVSSGPVVDPAAG